MVAAAGHHCAAPSFDSDCLFRRISGRAFYLHLILNFEDLSMNDTEVQKTNAVLAAALLIAFMIWSNKILLWLAILLLIGAATESRVNSFIARYWLKFSRIIGEINSSILLSLVFFIILTPVSILFRLFNKAAVAHFKCNDKNSYFTDSIQKYDKKYFLKQW